MVILSEYVRLVAEGVDERDFELFLRLTAPHRKPIAPLLLQLSGHILRVEVG